MATLVDDMRRWGTNTPAVVEHRGVRRYPTSYGELARLSFRVAAELERRGIEPGERVVLWGANSAAWIAVYFGCVLRGVLPVPLDAAGDPAFAAGVVREVRPRWMVGGRELLARLAADGISDAEHTPFDLLEAVLPPEPGMPRQPRLGPDSPLQIIFTSGTTGTPKGVVHTHGNLLASLGPIEREIDKYRRYERWFHPLRFLHTLPLSHVFGQFMGLWVPPLLGATVVYEDRLTAGRLLPLIAEERIHVLAAVPRTLTLLRAAMLAREPGLAAELAAAAGESLPRRWRRFRRVHRAMGLRFWAAVCGGATLHAEVEAFWTGLGFALIQGYGLTETAALVTLNHPFRGARGSLGTPLPGRSLQVAENGELLVRGAMISTATWQGGQLQQTKGGEWLPTGDLASIGEDGRVRFLGRTGQRLVTAAGLNVYLEDVERALLAEPEFGEVVVFALPSGDGGEEPAAVLIAQGGREPAAQVLERANRRLAPHQQVRRFFLWPELAFPRTGSGKVRRRIVIAWAEEQMSPQLGQGAPAEENDPVLRLLDSLRRRRGPVTDETRLAEGWGLDSMGRVALAAALEEKIGLESDSRLAEAETVGELRGLLRPQALSEPGTSLAQLSRSTGAQSDLKKKGVILNGVKDLLPLLFRRKQQVLPEHSVTRRYAPQDDASFEIHKAPQAFTELIAPRDHTDNTRVWYRYPRWPWSLPAHCLRVLFLKGVLWPLVRILERPLTEQHAELTASPPMLLISNHRTAMDVPLLLYALPSALRGRVAVAMSGEMLAGWQRSWSRRPMPPALEEHRRPWGPVAAFLLQALLNVFPLPRTAGFRESFSHAGRALDRGYSVLLFPEGRRASDGKVLPFKPGLGILAQEARVDVLPLVLHIPEKGHEKRVRLIVRVGTPVHLDPGLSPEQITAKLQGEVQALLRSAAPS